MYRGRAAALALLACAAACWGQRPAPARSAQVFQKVCGQCHAKDFVFAPRSRDQWQETVQKMAALGAKGSEEEFAIVLDYLVTQYGRRPVNQRPAISIGISSGRGAPGTGIEAGPKDKHVVDEAAAERAKKVWAAECINCHGTQARGEDPGTNLIRSELVLHDRYANEIGPFLRKGHHMQSGRSSAVLTKSQIEDVAHFIHLRVYDTLRSAPSFHPQDLLTGDPQAGAAFFDGEGRCASCHSPTGDLKGVGGKYEPPALQARFLNPRFSGRGGRGGAAPAPNRPHVTLTVTPPSGPPVTGTPVALDDFYVAVRDDAGEYHSWTRTPALKIEKNDPYAAHDDLLARYTDKQMHDLLAYLASLK
jgi:mono/diheme cytochrome c family protein